MERLAEGGASRMTIAEWTVFGAVLLYLLTVAPV
jgi:hypothetical protein